MKRLLHRIRAHHAAMRVLAARSIVATVEFYGADAMARVRAYAYEADAVLALRKIEMEASHG